MVPRIRGRAGIAEEGEHKGKWFYEISLWDLTGEHQVEKPIQIGPFDSEDLACKAGREIIKDVSEKIEKDSTGKISGRYLDMKNGGVMRPWEPHS